MLRSPSLFVQPTSGFVPFSSGGSLDVGFDVEARKPARAVCPSPVGSSPGAAFCASVWAPASTSAIRRVEALVLAAMCGYFTFGLGKLIGLL